MLAREPVRDRRAFRQRFVDERERHRRDGPQGHVYLPTGSPH
jgi:hypothetical protein